MYLNEMSMLSTLCIVGKLKWQMTFFNCNKSMRTNDQGLISIEIDFLQ